MTTPKKAKPKNQKSSERCQNVIPLSFDKAIEGLLSIKPKRKLRKKNKRSKK